MGTTKFVNKDLIIDGVKFRQDNAVDYSRILCLREISQGLVELDHLVHGFVTDQRLSNEENHVGLVHFDKLRQQRKKR